MRCTICNRDLPSDTKPTARYCGTTCRSSAYRLRLRRQRESSQNIPAAEPRSSAATRSDSALPTSPQTRFKGRRGDLRAVEQMLTTATERILAALQARDLQVMRNTPVAWRIDMRQQVLAQAPSGAAGYRLVLPASRAGDPPRLVPRRKRVDGAAAYSLSPFQYPRDLRLVDGAWYRILWVDAQGHRVPSSPRKPVPGLYYFVGPPSAEDAATAAYQEALRMAKGTAQEASVKDAAVQYQVTLAQARENEAHMHRTAAASAEALHQMAALSKANSPARSPATPPAQSDLDPWKAFGMTTLIGVPSLLALWLGWREYKRWVEKSSAASLSTENPAAKTEGLGALDVAIKTLADKWPEISAHLRPLLAPSGGVAASVPSAPPAPFIPVASMSPPSPVPQPSSPVSRGPEAPPPLPSSARIEAPILTAEQVSKNAAEEVPLTPSQPAATSSWPPAPTPASEPSGLASRPQPLKENALAPAAMESVRPPSDSIHSAEELDPKELNRICALVLSADQSAYMLYEQRRRIALATGQSAPPAPWLPELSGEQRKEISRIAADPRQLAYLEDLQSRFIQATTPGRLEPLPHPLPELSPKERERANAMFSTPEHMLYAVGRILRTSDLLAGNPPRPERETTLPEKERKALNKLLRDRRMIAYISSLALQAEQEERQEEEGPKE